MPLPVSELSPRVGVPTVAALQLTRQQRELKPLLPMQRNRLRPGGREDHECRAGDSLLDFSGPGSSGADLALSLYID